MSDDFQKYYNILARDPHAFVHRSFVELNPQTTFLDNWHLAVLIAKLEEVRLGNCKRLIVNLPPRSLKSHCASIAFAAWLLGHNPSEQIIAVSYAQDLADKLARDCRTLMQSPFYQYLFKTRLSAQKQAVGEFETTQSGYRLSTSIGGVLTGRGANVIIIDDPIKPDDVRSETVRVGTNEWYDNTLYSRLNSKQSGAIIIVMQRVHEDDLVGHVLGQEPWDLISFPAIAKKDETFRVRTPYGPRVFRRKRDEVLHSAHEPREALERIRQTIGSYNFAGQYQQEPAPAGGGMIERKWFKFYNPDRLDFQFDQIVQSWDTANKPTELADYSVCTTWGVKENRFYLLNVFRKRLGYPELKRAVIQQAQEFTAQTVLIEDKASGTQLIQDLAGERVRGVTKYEAVGDKVMRMHSQTATIENGFVYVPQGAHWLEAYLHELEVFPRGKFDDQVDSTSQVLDWVKSSTGNIAILEYYRQEVERLYGISRQEPKIVKLKGPPSVTNIYVNKGPIVSIGEDGLFTVTEEQAATLMRNASWTRVA